MSYESLERELARRQSQRQSRRSKGDKKAKRKYSPYRRGGRKGSKARTRLAEGEDKLGKALAAARERAAKYAKPRLNITKLPDREQLSLKDFEERSAEIFRAEMDCPPATQDVAINTKNRNATIKNFDYGPLNVEEPGDYWKDIAKRWKTTEKAAKKSNCGNCVAFDRSPRMKACMPGETSDGEGVLGYCWMHHFKCHSARTCDTWAKGGPITTNKVSEGWQERAFGESKTSKAAETSWTSSYPGELPPWCANRNPRAIVRFPCGCGECDAESFGAESKDEAIVVEGYKPKRVETYKGTVALFYVGEKAEQRYGPMSVKYQERTLLLPPIPNSIVNPTGITVEDVDEIMQHYTGAPWTGEYVLFSDDTGHLVDSGRTRMYNDFDSEEFRAEPAMYVKCFECEKPGYSDEMSKIAFGYLCARCARPEINWNTYSAESGLNNTHRSILTYLSPFNPQLVNRKYGIPTGLTQREIGNAIGIGRTNATKYLQELVDLGLVTQIMRRPDGERRIVKVYLPTYEGRKTADSFQSEDLNGNGVIDAWETHAHENTLTGLAHEESYSGETFRANNRKNNLKSSQIREKAQEAFEGVTGWMWLDELTQKINRTLSPSRRIAPGIISRAIGTSKGGHHGFYITLNKRIFYYGDKDRGEFIKGVI